LLALDVPVDIAGHVYWFVDLLFIPDRNFSQSIKGSDKIS
jgi:hypothetical protein